MKTAEDWDKFFSERYDARKHPEWKTKSDLEMFSDMCSHIQLDAFKAGAEWAANIIPKFYCESHDRRYAARETRDRVVDEVSKLKEMPK